jgi:molybdenum cofactor cytidylyltransferase
MIAGVVLAAGAGRRFGGAKQLAPVKGRPLLAWAVDAQRRADSIDAVHVVLGAQEARIRSAVDLGDVTVLSCPEWSEGLGRSLATAAAALDGARAMVVTLGDQPNITPACIDSVVARWDGEADAVRATYDGQPGHPTLLSSRLFGDLQQLTGDDGAGPILRNVSVLHADCTGLGDCRDVDRPADLPGYR